MSYLILVRHGRSEWNDKGLWTGFTNVPLSDGGREEAKKTALALKDIKIDSAHTSLLKRAEETLEIILKELQISVPVKKDFALNERDYGKYTGKNKWAVKKEIGDIAFNNLRRGWNCPIPDGETLKMVYERVVPYYQKEILPEIKTGKNILVTASGNSLRAMVKYLENIPEEKVSRISIGTGEAIIYQLDADGRIISKETRSKNEMDV